MKTQLESPSANITNNKTELNSYFEVPRSWYKGLAKEAIGLLPDNIPEEVKFELLKDRGDPGIYIGNVRLGGGEKMKVPDFIKKEDYSNYASGANYFNEIVTESLAIECLEARHKDFEIINNAIEMTTFSNLEPDGLNDKYVGLIKHLQICYLTGRRADLDYYIQQKFNLSGADQLFIKVGSQIAELQRNKEMESIELSDAPNNEEWVGGRQVKENIFITSSELKVPLIAGILSIIGTPGIFLTLEALKNASSMSGFEFVGKATLGTFGSVIGGLSLYILHKTLKPVKNSTEQILMHELMHYLSQDPKNKRFGLVYYI